MPQINAFEDDFGQGSQLVKIWRDPKLADEEYRIEIGTTIILKTATPTGLAWGLQTLSQLAGHKVGCKVIQDRPEVSFRCLTLDVARRFHSLSTVRVLIHWCQVAKVRYLQLHLTDDQNWMFPTTVLKGVDDRNQTHHKAYTVAELSALQCFAAARGVTIIPEVDMPGHSELAAKVNPALLQIQGSQSTNCLNFASPEVRTLLKSLIQEVGRVFPNSPYIHIGGDEAWYPLVEKNEQFKSEMAKLGPKSTPEDVFVDFIGEMSDEIIHLGRTPIVWEGFASSDYAKLRISKRTLIVAWEGTYYPAKKLIPDGFSVINAGWDPYYVVNHFPYDVYTLVPLERLYKWGYLDFSIVADTTNKDTHFTFQDPSKVKGAMLCWWEGREWNAEQYLPMRIAAFGARLWNSPRERDYASFLTRTYSIWANLAKRLFPFKSDHFSTLDDETKKKAVTGSFMFLPDQPGVQIAVRMDGTQPTTSDILNTGNIKAKDGMVLAIQAFAQNKPVGECFFLPYHHSEPTPNIALGKFVSATGESDPQFPAANVTNGIDNRLDSYWLAYPTPQQLTIDLGSEQTISRIEVVASWASHGPSRYRLSVGIDQAHFEQIVNHSSSTEPTTQAGFAHRFSARKVRYIRLEALGSDLYPPTMMRINQIRVFNDSAK